MQLKLNHKFNYVIIIYSSFDFPPRYPEHHQTHAKVT